MAQGKKGRKVGRNKVWCANYKARFQREKNKVKRLNRHLKAPKHANDNCALTRRDEIAKMVGIRITA